MLTGTPFVPTPFATTVVSAEVASVYRRFPYISASEYKAAPTAVGTGTLVPGGNAGVQLQVLADTIMRASSWIDEHCFHTADGTLAASPSTEQGWVTAKSGQLRLICKYRPILEVQAIAVGPSPSQLQSLSADPGLSIGLKTITLPPVTLGAPSGDFFPFTGWSGRWYAVWQYVNGYAHTYLAADVAQGASSIEVAPAAPGGSAVFGIYPGTLLTIHDSAGAGTEAVVVSSVNGTTLELSAPTAYAHTVPDAPDAIRVSALPWAVEQACISLTSCLIKLRGTRAAVLPMQPGSEPPRAALIEAGGLEDYEVAVELLKPYVTVFSGHN